MCVDLKKNTLEKQDPTSLKISLVNDIITHA